MEDFIVKENMQYCRTARGSITECLEHLICAFDCKYIEAEELKTYKSEIDILAKMINGYIAFLKKSIEKK